MPSAGICKKGSKAVLKTRLPTMDAVQRKRVWDKEDAVDTSEDLPVPQEKRFRADGFLSPFPADTGIVMGRAQRRSSGARAHWDRGKASPLEGGNAAIPPARRISLIER